MSVLVVAAHPDDEVLGCGGTVARLASEGEEVTILILANGLTSRPGYSSERDAPFLELHHERAHRAGKRLGVLKVVLAGFPDQKMDTVPFLDVAQTIEREVTALRPHTVFTHHGGDLNLDHAIAFRATMVATRPVPEFSVRRLYTYEIASSTEWAFNQFTPQFQPNLYYQIEAQLETKVSALSIYESEIRPFPHPRSPEALRAIARRHGSVVGVSAAEAFCCVREIR